MKKFIPFLVFSFFCPFLALAQTDSIQAKKSWQTGASLGLDFSQLFQLNPRQGAGQNRIGAGTAIAAFAKYKKKSDWPGITRLLGNLVFKDLDPDL